jgi:hypothetical protein
MSTPRRAVPSAKDNQFFLGIRNDLLQARELLEQIANEKSIKNVSAIYQAIRQTEDALQKLIGVTADQEFINAQIELAKKIVNLAEDQVKDLLNKIDASKAIAQLGVMIKALKTIIIEIDQLRIQKLIATQARMLAKEDAKSVAPSPTLPPLSPIFRMDAGTPRTQEANSEPAVAVIDPRSQPTTVRPPIHGFFAKTPITTADNSAKPQVVPAVVQRNGKENIFNAYMQQPSLKPSTVQQHGKKDLEKEYGAACNWLTARVEKISLKYSALRPKSSLGQMFNAAHRASGHSLADLFKIYSDLRPAHDKNSVFDRIQWLEQKFIGLRNEWNNRAFRHYSTATDTFVRVLENKSNAEDHHLARMIAGTLKEAYDNFDFPLTNERRELQQALQHFNVPVAEKYSLPVYHFKEYQNSLQYK